jgi:hypothetical protein
MFGLMPNGKDIVPTATSWCGQISEGVKNIKRTTLFIFFTFLAFGLIDNRAAVLDLIRAMVGK